MPSAMGRSYQGPSFLMSAGARLIVICATGKGKPLLRRAVRTRSRDSRTAASGRPTTSTMGRPSRTSTSTRMG